MIFRIDNHLAGTVGSRGELGPEERVVELPLPEYFRSPVGYLCVANDGNYWVVESEYDVLAIAAVLPINVLRFAVKDMATQKQATQKQATVIPLHRLGRPLAV